MSIREFARILLIRECTVIYFILYVRENSYAYSKDFSIRCVSSPRTRIARRTRCSREPLEGNVYERAQPGRIWHQVLELLLWPLVHRCCAVRNYVRHTMKHLVFVKLENYCKEDKLTSD